MNVLSIIDRLPFFDSLTNLITQIGNPAKSKAHAWVYDYAPLTQDQIDAAYCGDWLPRRIVDVVPYHMTREWRTWQADQADKLYATEKVFQIRTKIREAATYDRLYGGGAILIGADTKYPDEPLRMDKVTQNGLKYLHVLHRWQLTEGDIVTDLESPDFGKPAWYMIRAEKGFDQIRIHRSRFAFFCSLKSPFGMSRSNSISGVGWGQSILDIVIRACIRAEAAHENGAALMEEAKLDVVGVPDLPAQMATKQGQERLVTRFSLANQLKSTNSLLLLGGNETYDRKQVSFAGIPELMHAHDMTACAAAKCPATVILGQSPAGLNATGESDTRNFYDEIKTYLGTDLQEIIGPLDEVLIRTTLGTNPKGIEYEWNPLWQLSESEKADNAQKKMTAVSTLGSTGLFAPEELRPAVADMIINDGFLPTLDQHMLSEGQMEELLGQQEQLQDPALQGGNDPQTDPGANGGTPKLTVIGGGKRDSTLADAIIQLVDEWKEEEHPRVSSGATGGQFTKTGEIELSPQFIKGKGVWKGSPIPKDVWPFAASKNKGHHVSRFMELKEKPAQDTPRYRAILNYFAHEAKYYNLADEVPVLRQKAAQSMLLHSQKIADKDPKKSQTLYNKYLELTTKTGGEKKPEVVSLQTGNVLDPPPEVKKSHEVTGQALFTSQVMKGQGLNKENTEKAWNALSPDTKNWWEKKAAKEVAEQSTQNQSLEEKWKKLSFNEHIHVGALWKDAKAMELTENKLNFYKKTIGNEPSPEGLSTIKSSSAQEAYAEWQQMPEAAKYQAAVKYGVVNDDPKVTLEPVKPSSEHPWDKLSKEDQEKTKNHFAAASGIDPSDIDAVWEDYTPSAKMDYYKNTIAKKVEVTVNNKTEEVIKVEAKAPEPPKPPPAATDLDLAKAKSTLPFPKYGKESIDQHINAFNEKYAGKSLTDPDQLTQKVADFKIMQAKVAEEKAKLGHVLAQKASMNKEEKVLAAIAKYGKDEEDSIRSLYNLCGSAADSYLELSGNGIEQGLNPVDRALVRAYTSSQIYSSLNEALRKGVGSVYQYKFAKFLNKTLAKLPVYKKTTWRKTTIPDSMFSSWDVGQAISWNAFSSSAKNEHTWSGKHVFEIEGETGRDIQFTSTNKGESEVLYPMNTMFQITKKEGNKVWLREI